MSIHSRPSTLAYREGWDFYHRPRSPVAATPPADEPSALFDFATNCLHNCQDQLYLYSQSHPGVTIVPLPAEEERPMESVVTRRIKIDACEFYRFPDLLQELVSDYLRTAEKIKATHISFLGMNFGETDTEVDFFLFGSMSYGIDRKEQT